MAVAIQVRPLPQTESRWPHNSSWYRLSERERSENAAGCPPGIGRNPGKYSLTKSTEWNSFLYTFLQTQLEIKQEGKLKKWYRGRDSNSQGYSPADFESAASTNSATPAQGYSQPLIVGNSDSQVKPNLPPSLLFRSVSGFKRSHIWQRADTQALLELN